MFYGSHFLKEIDFTPTQWAQLVELSAQLKKARKNGEEKQFLRGRHVALIFEKTSTRTRCAFETALAHQGATSTYLDSRASQIGHKESIADTARVLGRMFDAIEFRGNSQDDVEKLAQYAGVPVYNGLTDQWHPTQMLADALTIREHVDKPFSQVSYTYLGDARFNTGCSTLISSAMLGMDIRICAPKDFQPPAHIVDKAHEIAQHTQARILITDDVEKALPGSDAVATDIWVSMGEDPRVWEERIHALSPYQVNRQAMELTGNSQAIFMHCLPAFHDLETTVAQNVYERTGLAELEVTHDVFESEQSVVFDQAENRLHTIKAVLVATLSTQWEEEYFSHPS